MKEFFKPTPGRDCATPVLFSLLTIFIFLRLTGVSAWSWWLVLMPLWVWIIMLASCALFLLLAVRSADKARRKQNQEP